MFHFLSVLRSVGFLPKGKDEQRKERLAMERKKEAIDYKKKDSGASEELSTSDNTGGIE